MRALCCRLCTVLLMELDSRAVLQVVYLGEGTVLQVVHCNVDGAG